jgi:hypothetical protein
MPYFIVYLNSAKDEIVKMVPDKGRLHEAVDEAIKGEYLSSPVVKAYHSSNLIMVNTKERIKYVDREI